MKTTISKLSALLLAECTNTLASLIASFALPIVALVHLHASTAEIGILGAASTAAPLFFGLSAGVWADRHDLRKVLTWCGYVRVALVLVVPISLTFGFLDIFILCVVGFGISAIRLLYDASMSVAVPSSVSRENLTRANGWMEAVTSVSQILGPSIAGLSIKFASVAMPFFLASSVYGASVLFVRSATKYMARDSYQSEPKESHAKEILRGIGLLWRREVQRAIAICAASFNIFHTAFFTVFTVFAIRDLHLNPSTLGVVLSAIGVLGLLGAVGADAISRFLGIRTALVASLAMIGPLGMPILFADRLDVPYRMTLVAICLGTWDFAIVLHLVMEQTLRQLSIPVDQLSKVVATTRFVSWGADPFGALLGGFLAGTIIGHKGTLSFCLIGMSLSGLGLLASRGIRALGDNPNSTRSVEAS